MADLSVQVTVPHGGDGTHTALVAVEVDDGRLTDPRLCDDLVAEMGRLLRPVLDEQRVRRLVERMLADAGVTLDDLRDHARSHDLAELRGALALMLRHEGWSLSRIGRLLNRDHTTVLYAIGRAEALTSERIRRDGDGMCEQDGCDLPAMGGGRWCLKDFQRYVDDRRAS